jgi:hypothetical protein
MASPEHPTPNLAPLPNKPDLRVELTNIEQLLELADAIENPMERFFKRDQLLELRDSLQTEIDSSVTPPELP